MHGKSQDYEYRKHATQDARKEHYHGCESRQVLRAHLRTQFRTWGEANKKYRDLMGLTIVRLPKGKFRTVKAVKGEVSE